MGRLTTQDTYGHWIIPLFNADGSKNNYQQAINKLAEYENMGYDPHELQQAIEDKCVYPNGVWLINADGYYPYCSQCKEEPKSGELSKFCPNCGCDMRRKDE